MIGISKIIFLYYRAFIKESIATICYLLFGSGSSECY